MEVYYSAARTVIAGRLPEGLQFTSAISFAGLLNRYNSHAHFLQASRTHQAALGLKASRSTAIRKCTYSLALCPAEIRRHSPLMASCGNSEAFLYTASRPSVATVSPCTIHA